MKFLIAAGGKGTRLKPMTDHINKHLITVGGKTMIARSVETAFSMQMQMFFHHQNPDRGISPEIIVCTNRCDVKAVKAERPWITNSWVFAQKTPGVAGVVIDAIPQYIDYGEEIVLLLGDQFFENVQAPRGFDGDRGASILLYPVSHEVAKTCGILVSGMNKPIAVEKPNAEVLGEGIAACIVGAYRFKGITAKDLKSLKKSKRGEYEITSLINRLGVESHEWLHGCWTDMGTFDGIQKVEALHAVKSLFHA